jgi:hypothetical protein
LDRLIAVEKKASSEAFFCERGHEAAEHHGAVSSQAKLSQSQRLKFSPFGAIVGLIAETHAMDKSNDA